MAEKRKKRLRDQPSSREEYELKVKKHCEERELREKKDKAGASAAAADETVNWHQRYIQAESEKALIEKELAVERDKLRNAERKIFVVERQMEETETEFQCPICNEVFIEATTTNCGHTFCHFCIHKWMQLGHENCPVCRMKVTQKVAIKTLDNYTDKVYEQCESETRRAERSTLKEERLKLRRESGREAEREEQRELLREGIEAWQAHYGQAEREAMAWLAQWQADSEREEEREGNRKLLPSLT